MLRKLGDDSIVTMGADAPDLDYEVGGRPGRPESGGIRICHQTA